LGTPGSFLYTGVPDTESNEHGRFLLRGVDQERLICKVFGMKTSLLCVAAAVSLLVAGCDRPAATSSSSNGTIAFVDIDEVGKRLNRDAAIVGELKTENDVLVEKLLKERGEFQQKFNTEKQAAGEKPTDEQTKKLLDLEQQLNAELQSQYQEATQSLSTKRAALVQQFREEIKPIAKKIAAAKGMNTVLLRSDLIVLSVDPAADITDEVVAEMISAGKASPTPAASPATP